MQKKLKLSAVFLALLFAIIPFTFTSARAMTFDRRIPSFGLYCENQNADVHGKVKYVIDQNGKAVQYSEYTVNGTDELNIEIPFISNAFKLPQTDITVGGKAVTAKVCYGEKYYEDCELRFYSSEIDENLTGTLYKLKPDNESFTVNFKTAERQNFIYLLPYNGFSESDKGEFSLTLNNAKTDAIYEIFVINGDFAEFKSDAETEKETLTAKQYINCNLTDVQSYYLQENISADLLYALINRAIENDFNYSYSDFFFDSYSQQRLNAYKIELQTDTEVNTIAYSMPVTVQTNTAFNPAIFIAEQTATCNYCTDYTVELNGAFPYIIESSAQVEKKSDRIYTAQNISGDFYFVFSSSEKPEGALNNTADNALNIVLYVISGVAVCALIVIIILAVLHHKKSEIR